MNPGIRLNRWGILTVVLGWLVVAVLPGLAAMDKNPLETLKKEHPRLILNPQDVPLLKQAIETDPARRELYEKSKRTRTKFSANLRWNTSSSAPACWIKAAAAWTGSTAFLSCT